MHDIIILEEFNCIDQLSHEYFGQFLSNASKLFALCCASQLIDQCLQIAFRQVLEHKHYWLRALFNRIKVSSYSNKWLNGLIWKYFLTVIK